MPVRQVANQGREGAIPTGETLCGKRVSCSESEPDSASLRKVGVASLPEKMKPDIGGEATGRSSRRTLSRITGVVGDSARGKIGPGAWEARRGGGGDSANDLGEYITLRAAPVGSRRGP